MGATVITTLCIIFCVFKQGSEFKDVWWGLVVAVSSSLIVSVFFVYSEYVLQDSLKDVGQWNKQLLFAAFDIPLNLTFAFIYKGLKTMFQNPERYGPVWNIFYGI